MHNRIRQLISSLLIASMFALMGAGTVIQRITIEQHLFYPSRIYVPENTPIQLLIHNLDTTPEEFDSFSLNREKVIFPHRPTIIYLPKLTSGEYGFIGEYHPDTARGSLIVVPLHQYNTLQSSNSPNVKPKKGGVHVDK
ncbi:MAG: cupredoxin domain-containing protein [Glaciecola sp.]|jgi:hypothetical protein|nr:cupredoxin domain-containing protein [Glaciecola sp.]MDG2099273.1 cupredoxin domain-containing protein [Glaciecola sp.]